MKTIQMQSCVHDNGTVECTLVEVELPNPVLTRWLLRLRRRPLIHRILA
jgi:hypothetical protein